MSSRGAVELWIWGVITWGHCDLSQSRGRKQQEEAELQLCSVLLLIEAGGPTSPLTLPSPATTGLSQQR